MYNKNHNFGGHWTEQKLLKIKNYLQAYARIMNKQSFRFAYIDAFAGSGYRTVITDEQSEDFLFPEFSECETTTFLDGSARIALQVKPQFHKYIFIEKDISKAQSLESLKQEFPLLEKKISIINADANTYLTDLCLNYSWKNNRAVLFLDPYGMQVTWSTIEAISKTKAIDLWLLFPLGVAVNRLLYRKGNILPSFKKLLNELFGTKEWFRHFYSTTTHSGLFGEETAIEKISNFDSISNYFVSRLKTVFRNVAEHPLPLYNSRNNPLYLLCFASSNSTALKIAQDVLDK
ncbi:MAG TPA: three-Cys-motif partner protein TcmP [Bacteroidota bacterium]|nr:three-Cys-motif partner protein TcmP [Bacteroidota bacterium]